jgi:tetratricopeptide (TPR) repeat protein
MIRNDRLKVRRRAWLVSAVLFALLAISTPFAYRYWVRRQTADYRSRCAAATKAREWNELLAVSNAWRHWSPKDDDALMFIAQAAVELEQLEIAVEALGQVSDSYRGALQALATRADIQQEGLNRPFDAEATWLRMLEIDPAADLPRQRLIYFYAITLQRQKLVAQIEAAIRRGCEPPEAYVYLIMKDSLNFSDGVALTTRWRMAYPDSEVLAAAQAVYVAKHTEQEQVLAFASQTTSPDADAIVDRCLEKYPANLEALMIKLDRAVFEGDPERVLALMQKAPKEAETDGRFWRSKGWLLSTNGRQEDAAKSLQRAIDLNPFDWQAQWLLADVLRRLGNQKEADRSAELSMQGKVLQRRILARPNARDIDEKLLAEIHSYFRQASPEWILDAFERRLQ